MLNIRLFSREFLAPFHAYLRIPGINVKWSKIKEVNYCIDLSNKVRYDNYDTVFASWKLQFAKS